MLQHRSFKLTSGLEEKNCPKKLLVQQNKHTLIPFIHIVFVCIFNSNLSNQYLISGPPPDFLELHNLRPKLDV